MTDFSQQTAKTSTPTSIGRQVLCVIEDVENGSFGYAESHVEIDVLDQSGETMATREVPATTLVQIGVVTAAEVNTLKNLMQKIRTAAQARIVEGA